MATAKVLVVAGGGHLANKTPDGCGGGGAGGLLYDASHTINTSTAYTVTVGTAGTAYNNGTDSVFDTITASGGGKGGGNGGSGGGGDFDAAAGTGTGGQGNNGGTGHNAGSVISGGGGGGARYAGSNGFDNGSFGFGGTGGTGLSNSISGSSVTYAGGGGGAGQNENNGANYGGGTSAYGGGGGGNGTVAAQNGVVILSYTTGALTALGGTITTSGGNTIHTFTTSGTFTTSPFVTTQAVSQVDITTATGNGTLLISSADKRGVVYDTSSHADPGNVAPSASAYHNRVEETGSFSAVAFTEAITSLASATVYYVRAYTHDATAGYFYGDEVSFTTNSDQNMIVIQDSNGYIWIKNLASGIFFPIGGNQVNTTPLGGSGVYGNGNGLSYFIGSNRTFYLFVANGNRVEVFNFSAFMGNNTTWTWYWTDGAKAFTNTTALINHSALWGQDNRIYFCDVSGLSAFNEVAGQVFDPTNAVTFGWNLKVLNLPAYASAQCLEELGVLLIGDANSNYIFPWDRISTSFTTPLRVPENNIWKMININNVVYLLAGNKGVVYTTTGYMVDMFKKLPEYLTGGQVVWGGLNKVNGHLVIGVGTYNGGDGQFNSGVYKLFLHTLQPGTLTIDNTPSTAIAGGSGSVNNELPTVLLTVGADEYFVGYSRSASLDDAYGAVDLIANTNSRYSNYEAYIEAPIVTVSTVQEKRNFEELGINFSEALQTGEGVSISSRLDLGGTYTTLGVFDYATQGAMVNDFLQGNIVDANALQLKVYIKAASGGTNPPEFTPRLKEVSIK